VKIITQTENFLEPLVACKLLAARERPKIVTGLPAIDMLPPGQGFSLGVVHEFISATYNPPVLLPVILARAASKLGWIVWCDFSRQFYPPAAAMLGLPLDRLLILRARKQKEEFWAATEILRCQGIAACVLPLTQLTALQARRLQLASEKGGGIGVVLRSAKAASHPYAAATRWLITPLPGKKTAHRCEVN